MNYWIQFHACASTVLKFKSTPWYGAKLPSAVNLNVTCNDRIMPKAYAVDLRWRVVWLYLAQNRSSSKISSLLLLSECSVRRYISLFYRTGDVEPVSQRHGPQKLLGDFGQLTLLHIILSNPGIYLSEIKEQLTRLVGVEVSVSTICRTLKFKNAIRRHRYGWNMVSMGYDFMWLGWPTSQAVAVLS